ncbi:hypothetical protein FTUN_3842 [Frigoriglobus tundricola]|uniref:Uncharacterized protein n=1 Tax=Frigoriglobus tundricola TaxID=2774151 RepID=A0A6M5YQJ7_9BACT|nr:hypothetical protein FTUN_3842 [Frigoriglobus tundricola]
MVHGITRVPPGEADAERLLVGLVREHGRIENPRSEDRRSDNLCDTDESQNRRERMKQALQPTGSGTVASSSYNDVAAIRRHPNRERRCPRLPTASAHAKVKYGTALA